MSCRKFLLLVLGCFVLWDGACQNNEPDFTYRLDVISINEGLRQHDVRSILQDRYGFIWIATYDGLHRYDGYNFKIFRHQYDDPGTISDNRVLFLYEDSQARFWIATEGGGLNLYDYDQECFTTFKLSENPVDNNVYCIYEDHDQYLWLGTSNGLYRTRLEEDHFQVERIPSPVNIRVIAEDHQGALLLGTQEGAYVLDRKGTLGVERLKHLGYTEMLAAESCDDGSMLLGMASGLFIRQPDGDCRQVETDLFQGGVCAITRSRDGEYIIVTELNGVFRVRVESGHCSIRPLKTDNDYLMSTAILKSLYIDNMQNLWIGTGTNGVWRVNLLAPRFFRYYTGPEDGSAFIRAFLHDSYGRDWIQMRYQTLRIYENGSSGQFQPAPKEIILRDPPPFDERRTVVTSLLEDHTRTVWLCTEHRLYRFPAGREIGTPVDLFATPEFQSDVSAPLATLYCIQEDNMGNIWVGSWNGLLQIRRRPGHRDEYRLYTDFDFQVENGGFIQLFCEKDQPRIWVCSRNFGLLMLDLDESGDIVRKTRFSVEGPSGLQFNSNHVWFVNKGQSGIVWVGTDAGLNSIEVDSGRFVVRRYDITRLHNDKILALQEDRFGDLWLNTSRGLLRFTPATRSLRQYYAQDGLSSSALTDVCRMDSTGLFYVCSINGVTCFRPEEVHDNPFVPRVAFSSLKIFNKEVEVGRNGGRKPILARSLLETQEITLRHNQNNFTLEFIALHFNDPARNQYAHKLEGYDAEWIVGDGRNRAASYNNLPAGRYVFKVKAANSDGVWNDECATMEIEILPAPWATWWAYLLYVLALVAIVYFIILYYRRQQILENRLYLKQLEYEQDRVIAEAREKFHVNITHELRTPLTLILAPLQDLIDKARDEWSVSRLRLIERNTNRLLALVNQFLDLRKLDKESMPLHVRETEVTAIVARLVDNFRLFALQKKIRFSLVCESPRIVGWIDEEKLVKILNNLISNSFKFTSERGCITVVVSVVEDRLQISVEDSGCGIGPENVNHIFDRFYQVEHQSVSGTGIGLPLAQKLAELHHGTITVRSQEGVGSVFTVTLPLSAAAYGLDEPIRKLSDSVGPARTNDPLFEEKPIVLIVEDEDDMRQYLEQCLAPTFEVISEDNALSGREAALKYIPNLIITDVMMPGMDGFEFCRLLKSDFRTSHIPVIILTAKSEETDVIEGYQSGAEDYLTKPFNREQLLLKIRNIVRFRSAAGTDGKEETAESILPLNDREQRFLDKLTALIKEHIDDTDYSVESVCYDIGISRMQLHRKLTAILGKTTSEFIRDIKMERARELLASGNYNVSETIYMVGFKSNSHFTRVFRDTFGVTPSEFIRKTSHS